MQRAETAVPTLLLTGPAAVGKSRVGLEIGRILRYREIPHAFVDVDALAYGFPTPPDDRFHQRLALRNLADVWRHHHANGARVLVLARVLENRSGLEGYRQAVPDAAITVVRLRAPLGVLKERLQHRGDPHHLDRARQLLTLMDDARVEDLLVETEGKNPEALAHEILATLNWPPSLD